MQYDGFIYIWFDKIKRRYYIGSHKGLIDDSYTGSGILFRNAYNKRPTAFKRRILEYVSGNKTEIQKREQAWLNLIQDHELGTKYYNMKKFASGGTIKGKQRAGWSDGRREKTVTSLTGKKKSEDYKTLLSDVVARRYTFKNLITNEVFIGSTRAFAIQYFSLKQRATISNYAYKTKQYGQWQINF